MNTNAFLIKFILVILVSACPCARAEERVKDAPSGTLLCGVNVLYLSLKFLGDTKVSYYDLVDFFPDIENKGTTMARIQSYLEGKRYYCKFSEVSFPELETILKTGCHAYIFQEGNDVSHLLLARTKDDGSLQLLSPPYILMALEPAFFKNKKIVCLFVSNKPIPEIFPSYTADLFLLALSLAGGFFLYLGIKNTIAKNSLR